MSHAMEPSGAPLPPPTLEAGRPLVDSRYVMAWMSASLFWMIWAPVFGLLAAAKLDDPDLLAGIEQLQFARLRIAHVNGVVFGLFSTAIFGFMAYAVPKLCGRPLTNMRAAWWGFALFNVAVLIGEVCLLAGVLQPLEAGEYPFFVDCMVALAFVTLVWVFIQTIVRRTTERIYVSIYYWTAGMLWSVVNFVLGAFILPNTVTGANSAAMHGFYLHNVVGLWITPMGLGLVYYVLPTATRARLYSHKLSLIGFWALAFFYPLNGVHHYIYSPIAEWAQTIAIAASMMLILPVWAFSANVWGTMRGQWRQFAGPGNYALKFLILGAVWYLITCFQGPTQALRGIQALTHFGEYNVGHAHSAVYGAFAIWAMSGIYYVVPRLTGRQLWSNRLGSWHYWLQIFGFTIMFTVLTIAGFVQGTSLLTADQMWITTVNQIKDFWIARTFGGTLMDVGLALFVFNIVMTVILGKREAPPEFPAGEPAKVGA
jgi:cytochrome c oxidase cbb3-type subunit 1